MGISPVQLLIVLAIVVLVFGGKRLRSLGSDLGHAIKGFKEVTNDDKSDPQDPPAQERIDYEVSNDESRIIDGQASKDKDQTH